MTTASYELEDGITSTAYSEGRPIGNVMSSAGRLAMLE